jgi:Domain of unknown function (DUF4403)
MRRTLATRPIGRSLSLLSLCLGAAALATCSRGPSAADSSRADTDFALPPPAPAETSRFSVPLDYDFSAILRVVERVVPKSFGSMDSVRQAGDDTHRHYAFEADRGPFTAFADGRLVHLQATLDYSVRGWFKPIIGPTIGAGCGKDPKMRPRLVIEMATPLNLTDNWHLASHAQLVRVEPASSLPQDHCDVSILHKDITPQVVEAARLGIIDHLPDIDKKVAEVDLKSRFVEWWGLLARPIRLADGVWLFLGPDRLAMGRVRGAGHTLRVPVTLAASPQIITSADTPSVGKSALPPLGRDTTMNGFRILMDGVVGYDAATKAVSNALQGHQLTESGRTVRIDTMIVAPATRGRLALTVAFSGDAHGRLRFLGTPVYNAKKREVLVPDLDYDLQTDNALINTYAWLKADDLRMTFRQRARFSVGDAIDRGKEMLLLGLNRTIGDALTLGATVDSVAVKNLFVTKTGLIVRGEATGQAHVAVHQR